MEFTNTNINSQKHNIDFVTNYKPKKSKSIKNEQNQMQDAKEDYTNPEASLKNISNLFF